MSGAWLFTISAVVLVVAYASWRRHRALALACEQLSGGLEALAEGRMTRLIRPQPPGPVGRLVRTFNDLAPRLEGRIAQLERDRQQLGAVLSGMAEAVIAIDGRQRLVFANPGADELFGINAQAVGRLVPELIRNPQIQTAIDATLQGRGSYHGEISVPVRDLTPRNHPRVLAVNGTALPGSPPSGAVLVFHDVTELRRLERMRQDFVANVSHELKTPLASIKAYTETLLDWALADEKVNVRFLKRIEEQAERLNQLILDLLALARLESGQEIYQHGPLVLCDVLKASVEAARGRAEAKRLDFTLDLDAFDEATLVMADEEAIRQILDNLIDNAIKYTPEDGRVQTICSLSRDGVVLVVADSGIGIPREDLPRVFERFYRVDKARSREMGGTGLGLSIVKHLVQSIGGKIAVDSRLGVGTTFTVQLPRHEPAAARVEKT